MTKQVALYFGSFNPIHIGHLIIANTMVSQVGVNELWFVVSPQNPLKLQQNLLADHHRLQMVMRAIDDNDKLRVCDAEFHLPVPSYTVVTLAHLSEKYPQYKFSIIMGGDNLATLPRWRNYKHILDNYHIYVYPRPNMGDCPLKDHPNVTVVDVPMMDISSSYIRNQIHNGRDVRYLLTDTVYKYIEEMHFYK